VTHPSASTWSQGITASGGTLSSSSFGNISREWDSPCEAMFEYLAQTAPLELIRLASGLRPSQLTFAAEWLGRSGDPRARLVLLGLLRHVSPLVREGAIYGLEALGGEALAAARQQLAELTLPDVEPSPGVLAAAREALYVVVDG
jgi:hypothetical protein